MERKAAALKEQMEVEERLHENRVSEGTTKLAEGQKAQLRKRAARSKARGARATTRSSTWIAITRLFALPGGGGVAAVQVEQKRNAYLEADNAFSVAQSKLSELDFRLSHEYSQAKAQLETSGQEATNLRCNTIRRCARSRARKTSCVCNYRARGSSPMPPRASASRISTRTISC